MFIALGGAFRVGSQIGWRSGLITLLLVAAHCTLLAAPQPARAAADLPTLQTPAAGEKTFLPFPHFTWSAHPKMYQLVAEPVSYDIQIASDAAFTKLVDEDTVFLNRYIHDRPLAPGEYFWRVRTVLYNQPAGEWSAPASFTVTPCDAVVQVVYNPAATDHYAAVQAAVAQARQLGKAGKSVHLVFPKGTYRFDKTSDTLLRLDDMRNLIVDGQGSKIEIMRVSSGLTESRRTENVVLMGFVVDYPGEKTFIEGRITAVDPAKKSITVRLEPGEPDYTVPYIQHHLAFLSLLDPKIDGKLKSNSYNAFLRSNFAEPYQHNADGTWQLTFKQRPELIEYFAPGDRMVHFMREFGGYFVMFFFSRNTTVYDITSYSVPSLHYAAIEGSLLNVLHCQTRYNEGRWFSGNGDGVHCRGYEVGPWIEGCDIQGIGDDGVALYARPSTILKAQPAGRKNAALCNPNLFNLAAGDEVAFFTGQTGQILLECRVTSVEMQPDKNPLVTFDQDLPAGIVPVSGPDGKIITPTQIWNRSKSGGEFMIRNNKIHNIRRFGTVFRARRGVIEDNLYEAASASGILFTNEPQYPNGLYCSDIIIRNNTLRNVSFDRHNRQPIAMHFLAMADKAAASIGPRRILIEGNTFEDCFTPEAGFRSAAAVLLRNNAVKKNGAPKPLEIKQEHSEKIVTQP